MKTILAPIDLSPHSDAVINTAIKIAKALRSEVLVMHVIDEDVVYHHNPSVNEYMDTLSLLELKTAEGLKACLQTIEKHNLKCRSVYVVGIPADRILQEARRSASELIVMGVGSHNFEKDKLINSAAVNVLKKAFLPVVLVPLSVTSDHQSENGSPTSMITSAAERS